MIGTTGARPNHRHHDERQSIPAVTGNPDADDRDGGQSMMVQAR